MKKIVKAIYELVGEDDDIESPKELVRRVFQCLDKDKNCLLSEKEFIEGLSKNPQLMKMLAPRAHNQPNQLSSLH